MNDLVPFRFQGVSLKVACWVDRKPYFTRRAIGEWLGYVRPRPDVAITKIVAKNPHIKTFATTVNLTVVDEYPKGHSDTRLVSESSTRTREMEIEVYDPIGLQLIVMESRQPKAIAYKIAVAHLVWAYINNEITFKGIRHIPEPPTLDGLANVAPWTRGIGKAMQCICVEIGRCPNTVRRYMKKIRNGEPILRGKTPGKMAYVHKKYRDKYDEVLRLRSQGLKLREIKDRTGVGINAISYWTKGRNSSRNLLTLKHRKAA